MPTGSEDITQKADRVAAKILEIMRTYAEKHPGKLRIADIAKILKTYIEDDPDLQTLTKGQKETVVMLAVATYAIGFKACQAMQEDMLRFFFFPSFLTGS
ncbi:MAG: hypothetical protein ACXQTS_04410 [Candidatus Methanospirareceae archaeon]